MKRGIIFILLINILFTCISCNSSTTENVPSSQTSTIDFSTDSESEASIIGVWEIKAAVHSGEVTPLPDGPFLDIERDGEYLLFLDENTKYSGQWKQLDYTGNKEEYSDNLNPYVDSSEEQNINNIYRLKTYDGDFLLLEMDNNKKYIWIGNETRDAIMLVLGE